MIRSGLSFGGELKQILIVTFLFIGCGDEDGTESNSTEAYCLLYQDSEVGQVQTCDYYANLSEAQLQTAQNACISQTVPGNWITGESCPTLGRIGNCMYRSSGLTTIRWEYSPTVLESAIHNCTEISPKGPWTTGSF